MGKNLALVVDIIGNSSLERGLTDIFGQTSEDEFQIAFEVLDTNGDRISPENLIDGEVTVSIRPTGQADFIPADHVIKLTDNEFFRPFRVNPNAIRFNVDKLDPDTATVRARITAV